MARITYYVAVPFVRSEDDCLIAEQAVECPSSNTAVAQARTMARTAAGAVAFSRTGDPDIGEFDDAAVLATFGDVPAD